MERRVIAIASAVGIVAGIALGGLLLGGEDPATPAVGSGPDEIAALRQALDAERIEREALAAEVRSLRFALETLGAMEGEAMAALEPPGEIASARNASEPAEKARADQAPSTPRGEPWFDAEALEKNGFAAQEIERLRSVFESYEMEELYLRDQAIRENWFRSKRWRKAQEDLRNQRRADLGEEDWDWMLFATGSTNRVRLDAVLESSPASNAGFQPGDIVVRYDDERIFQPRDLQRATTGGEPGGTIAVDVLRGGEERRLYVPRGPLGARLRAIRQPPQTG